MFGRSVTGAHARELRAIRSALGYVFQDPAGSLHPHRTIVETVARPLLLDRTVSRTDAYATAAQMLDAVRLPSSIQQRMPHELSGGQCQRVSLARALVRRPRLVIADEPTSALDVTVQALVLQVFRDLQRELGFAALFITHDLAVVSELADRVAVMRRGRVVEIGPTEAIFANPQHAYTKALLSAIPVPDPELERQRRPIGFDYQTQKSPADAQLRPVGENHYVLA